MTVGRYLEGVALGLVCLGALTLGAHRLRRRLAPFYTGIVAWIADAVMLVALLIVALLVVGIIGVFDLLGVIAGCVVVGGLAFGIAARGDPPRVAAAPEAATTRGPRPVAAERPLVTAVAIAGVSVASAAWLGWTVYTYRTGMTTVDTLWYHMPLAARFVQLHNIRHLQYFDGSAITAFYPANSELIHAFGLVLFGNDVLSPLVDVGWGAAALGSAWAIGRPWGREPHCLLACLPVLISPGFVDTQPGGAYDDIVCLALLLASLALIVNGIEAVPTRRIPLGTSALAALAAGLALGTKYTMIVPAIALGLGVVLVLARGQRLRHAGAWAGGLTVVGAYWYVRDGIAVGNPLPSLNVHLGPVSLPSPRQPQTYTVWQYLTERHIWQAIFIPGLRESLGLAWWALILGAITGGVWASLRGRDARLPLIGALALLSGFVFLVTPQLLGLPGDPIFFNANVRYAATPLALGLIALALAAPLGRVVPARVWLGASALALLFTALDPGVWRSGFPVTPFHAAIRGGPAIAGAALGAVILLAGEAWLWRGPQLRAAAHSLRQRGPTIALGTAVAGATAIAVAAGWIVSDAYAHDRYRDAPPLPAVYAWARTIHHARIGLFGFNQQYPLSGPDDSNYVQYIGVAEPHRGFAPAATCRQWRTAINRGHYDDVLVTPVGITTVTGVPELRWTQTSPEARPILRQYLHGIEFGVVFAITGRLDPGTCPG